MLDDVNKIVLMGDGGANFGDLTGPLSPKAIVEQWLGANGNNSVAAVAIGASSFTKNALGNIIGDKDLVLEVTEWIKLLNILDALVKEICNIQ